MHANISKYHSNPVNTGVASPKRVTIRMMPIVCVCYIKAYFDHITSLFLGKGKLARYHFPSNHVRRVRGLANFRNEQLKIWPIMTPDEHIYLSITSLLDRNQLKACTVHSIWLTYGQHKSSCRSVYPPYAHSSRDSPFRLAITLRAMAFV